MESLQHRCVLPAVVWLLIAASLLMSIASLAGSRGQGAAELKNLEERINKLESDLRLLQSSDRVVSTVGTKPCRARLT
jgi:hypothetical protein